LETAVKRDLLRTLVYHRETKLASAADSHTEDELIQHLNAATLDLSLINLLVVEMHSFKGDTPVLSLSEFNLLLEQFSRWAHFTDPIYSSARSEERRILLDAARQGTSFGDKALEEKGLKIWWPDRGLEVAASSLKKDTMKALSEGVFQDLKLRFSRKGGIGALWGRDKHLALKYLLFKRDSGFYSADLIKHLHNLSD